MKPCRHPERVATCRVCTLYATREDYRRLWGGEPQPKVDRPVKETRGPCFHLGVVLDGPKQAPCKCRHVCEAGVAEYAVPSGNCQTCPPETDGRAGYTPR